MTGSSQAFCFCLLQVVIESDSSATEYESFAVQEGSRVNPDMHMNHAKTHVYVTTEKQVGTSFIYAVDEFAATLDELVPHTVSCLSEIQ